MSRKKRTEQSVGRLTNALKMGSRRQERREGESEHQTIKGGKGNRSQDRR